MAGGRLWLTHAIFYQALDLREEGAPWDPRSGPLRNRHRFLNKPGEPGVVVYLEAS
jgi:hypothetical protein